MCMHAAAYVQQASEANDIIFIQHIHVLCQSSFYLSIDHTPNESSFWGESEHLLKVNFFLDFTNKNQAENGCELAHFD